MLLLVHFNAMQVFDTFANVEKQLCPVLAHNIYSKVVGRLINMAAERIISEVVAMDDIGVQETVQVCNFDVLVRFNQSSQLKA